MAYPSYSAPATSAAAHNLFSNYGVNLQPQVPLFNMQLPAAPQTPVNASYALACPATHHFGTLEQQQLQSYPNSPQMLINLQPPQPQTQQWCVHLQPPPAQDLNVPQMPLNWVCQPAAVELPSCSNAYCIARDAQLQQLRHQIALKELEKHGLEALLLQEHLRSNPFQLQFHYDKHTSTDDLLLNSVNQCQRSYALPDFVTVAAFEGTKDTQPDYCFISRRRLQLTKSPDLIHSSRWPQHDPQQRRHHTLRPDSAPDEKWYPNGDTQSRPIKSADSTESGRQSRSRSRRRISSEASSEKSETAEEGERRSRKKVKKKKLSKKQRRKHSGRDSASSSASGSKRRSISSSKSQSKTSNVKKSSN